MKQIVIFAFLFSLFLLPYCTTTKNAAGKNMKEPAVTYTADVAPIIQDRCTPCHFPETGKKKFLDTYAAARDNIDSILVRSEEHTSELQSQSNLVCRLLLEKKKKEKI